MTKVRHISPIIGITQLQRTLSMWKGFDSFPEGTSPRIHLYRIEFWNSHRLEGVLLQNSKGGISPKIVSGKPHGRAL
jgi:hypothetical protein